MQAVSSSEKPVDFQQITSRYIPGDRTLYNHRCENLKSYMDFLIWFSGINGNSSQTN
jgi:hypothetical protein